MKNLILIPVVAAALSACVVAPPAPPMIARLPANAMPAPVQVQAQDGWRVVSVTPVAPGTARDPNVTIEPMPEQRAMQAAPVIVQQPAPVYYYPQPVYVERPVYVDPWPVAVGVGLTLGWLSNRWCCNYRHHGRRH